MSETAPQPVAQEPTKIPPPVAAGAQGAGALAEGKTEPDNPFEFEVDVKGQKQKLKFAGKDQLTAVLQKALYADQVIKDGVQAKKGSEMLMSKLKSIASGDVDALEELMSDPFFKGDTKTLGLNIVKRLMDREKRFEGWTPEQVKAAERAELADKYEADIKARQEAEENRQKQEKLQRDAQTMRGEIIKAMDKYPDIPKTQATMDGVIQNMRAGFKRFGKHLSAEQAMTVYSQQYWNSLGSMIEKMEPAKILERFGSKTLDKIQQFKLNQLKEKMDPSKKQVPGDGEVKKKKHLTEKEFEKHFSQTMGLAGL